MKKYIILLLCLVAMAAQAQRTTKSQPRKTTRTTATARTQAKKTATPAGKGKTSAKKKTSTKGNAKANAAPKVTNASIQKLQQQQSALQSQIKESERLLNTTKKDVRTQLSNLAVITSQIGEKKRYVEGIQQQVDTMTKEISVLEKELVQLQAELDECKAKFQRGTSYLFRSRTMQNKLMFLFSAQDYKTLYRRARYMQEYAKYQRVQGVILKEKEDAVRTKREEVKQAKSAKEQLAAAGRAEQKSLEGKQAERQQVVDDLNKKSAQLQSAIAADKKKYANLNAQIDRLIQEEIRRQEAKRLAEEKKRREAEERARREAARKANAAKGEARSNGGGSEGKSGSSSGKSSSTSSRTGGANGKGDKPYANGNSNGAGAMHEADDVDRKLSASFASNQGRLPVPITGSYSVTGHFGQNSIQGLSGVSIPNMGTNYTGQPGAQARAVFEGEVVSVFNVGGMLNIIVRHGSYMTVYCNLSSAAVHRGQKVSTKQTLGSVARDASGNCTLQFQIRKQTAKLNPESWIAR